jgi:DNA repair exonuclease SbcCD nuclease subunit
MWYRNPKVERNSMRETLRCAVTNATTARKIKVSMSILKIGHISDIHAGHTAKTIQILEEFFQSNREQLNSLDVLVIAGDIASTSTHQIETAFRLLRDAAPEIPILCVFGNHDYWTKKIARNRHVGYWEICRRQDEILQEFNVHHLGRKGPVQIGDTKFWGFDGWYDDINISAHNRNFLAPRWQTEPSEPFAFMRAKAIKDFDALMQDTNFGGTKIIVTHMPPLVLEKETGDIDQYKDQCEDRGLASFLEPISQNFDYCLMGHFHRYYEEKIGRCTFRTTGCHYNKPILRLVSSGCA